jgi:hypothetical protein
MYDTYIMNKRQYIGGSLVECKFFRRHRGMNQLLASSINTLSLSSLDEVLLCRFSATAPICTSTKGIPVYLHQQMDNEIRDPGLSGLCPKRTSLTLAVNNIV